MMGNVVRCDAEGSGCFALRGAGIKQIIGKAVTKAEEMREGILVVEGGGNSLGYLDDKETVDVIVKGVRMIREKNKDVKVAVVGVLPRPKEGEQYEKLRVATNRRLGEALCSLKASYIRNKDCGDVSYLDPDPIMNDRLFARDGVHLNREGVNVLGNKLKSWVTGAVQCINYAKRQERTAK
jgi:lysophospholipase L1-like esterase